MVPNNFFVHILSFAEKETVSKKKNDLKFEGFWWELKLFLLTSLSLVCGINLDKMLDDHFCTRVRP